MDVKKGLCFWKGIHGYHERVESYLVDNKDSIAKLLLGAVGDLVAFGLTEGGKALISHLAKKKEPQLDAKSREILRSLAGSDSKRTVHNVTAGSGIKQCCKSRSNASVSVLKFCK